MIDRIDVKLLTAAIALAKELDYPRAAKKLNISRIDLTRQIAELEQLSSLNLFRANGGTLEITDAGQQFVRECCNVLRVRDVQTMLPASDLSTGSNHKRRSVKCTQRKLNNSTGKNGL